MKLKVLTTSREIRALLNGLDDGIIDRFMSIGEFFSKAVVVPKRRFVDSELRKLFLYRALCEVDARELGLDQRFVHFFKSADFVLDFFSELSKERVGFEELHRADAYGEFSEHLRVLERLKSRYVELLEERGFVDSALIEEFEINEPFFRQFEKVELEVIGYLSRFEREVLDRIPIDLELRFRVSPFNKSLIKKMFGDLKEGEYRYDFKRRSVIAYKPLSKRAEIESAAFSDRIYQVHYVLASIQELWERGCDPDKIAVILPDESFEEYLELFNNGNLNFAMGRSFCRSNLYIKLQALYEYLVQEDEVAYKKAQDIIDSFQKEELLELIQKIATPKELMVIEEELYRLRFMLSYFQDKKEQLHFILQRFEKLRFDDTEGGKVTVMGVLESRGMEFDGVVIVDFNEEKVPNVGSSDLFLNSSVRSFAKLPTQKEKEALQKHYYDEILRNSRFVRVCYVHNEEQTPSRFLYELEIEEGEREDEVYKELLFKFSDDPKPLEFDGIEFEKPLHLTPTKLSTLLECPMRYYFEYVLGLVNDIEEERVVFGRLFHEAVATLLAREPLFDSWQSYYERLKEEIFKRLRIDERFEIVVEKDEALRWFCQEDFKRLAKDQQIEEWGNRSLGSYRLSAKFDRKNSKYVIDYKTGALKESDRIQMLFYAYIFDEEPLVYSLSEKRVLGLDDFEIKDVHKELKELLQKVECRAKRAEDEKSCRWCPYTFMCKREL